ncbi:hypothetical protein [Neorhodopirellula pilleata]|uniref:Uncharacterized protein n=1 Tax=Neorhodopirellula pilleata TaxID=2714738 RepID=A0A5C5ZW93_9BACT|nr:hypothetical protein [Neorhodopirellula pilleata]TWT91420.1 hypothetical protein Pla100_52700 [Neorhodopirellula pilleata]TWT91469.1 hypothetical protein Pla100_53190 [Neorhodopirellula pilleata]
MNDADRMDFDEAVSLAQRIRADRKGVIVRAVGRFLTDAELRGDDQERWGVSVLLADGRSTVFWSTLAYAMQSPPRDAKRPKRDAKRPKRETKRPKRETKRPKRESIDSRQEALF